MSVISKWLSTRAVLLITSVGLAILASSLLQIGSTAQATLHAPQSDSLDPLRTPVQALLEQHGYTLDPSAPIALLPLAPDAGTFQWAPPFLISTHAPRAYAAIVQATPQGQSATDLIRVTVERASEPSNQPIRLGSPFNLTHSRDAAERIESHQGHTLVASSWVAGRCLQLITLDVSGEPAALTESWSTIDQWKNHISTWQTTGQSAGITRHDLLFSRPPSNLTVTPDPSQALTFSVAFQASKPIWTLHIPPASTQPPTLKPLAADAQPIASSELTKGNPGHLGWFVDTVRDLSWVGPRKIAAAEHLAFEVLDILKRTRVSLFGPGTPSAPTLAASDDTTSSPPLPPPDPSAQWVIPAERHAPRVWPPKPAKPILDPPGEGEGQWVPMTRLVKPAHDRVPYFYQSWLRPDRSRPFAVMSVTAWDSSRVQLGFVAGTREPAGTTGMKGTGLIPRRPGLMPSVVAAFNGGFQTKHGAYGMVVEDRVLLPPVGGGASVVRTRDARTFLGTWPTDPKAEAPRPGRLPQGAAIPKPIFSVRQNLQPLVDGGVINPTGRAKWGGTAGIGTDSTHTTRTGICLMDGTTLAYFYGNSVDADAVGRAMLAYGCSYGVHLDMNAGHSGFEFYNIKDEEGTDFEASRMIQKMGHMKYPRYVKRDVRDYFYLTLNTQTAQRLAVRSKTPWSRPFPLEKDAPIMVDLPPAEVLQSTVSFPDSATASVLRIPKHRVHASTSRMLTDQPPPVSDPTASLVAFSHVPAQPQAHLTLTPRERFGDLLEAPGKPGTTTPVFVYARGGAALPDPPPNLDPETSAAATPESLLVLAFSKGDVFVVHVPFVHRARAVETLLALGARDIVALPTPASAPKPSVRFENSKRESLWSPPPTAAPVVGLERLVLYLSGRESPTGRVEDLFPKPSNAPNKPSDPH